MPLEAKLEPVVPVPKKEHEKLVRRARKGYLPRRILGAVFWTALGMATAFGAQQYIKYNEPDLVGLKYYRLYKSPIRGMYVERSEIYMRGAKAIIVGKQSKSKTQPETPFKRNKYNKFVLEEDLK